ncbi:MAG: Gfo/Idh/MocA family protein [Armatimonadota bacterium]
MNPVKVGLVGCGQISKAYLENLTGMLKRVVEVVACSDLIAERAQQRASQFGVPAVCTTEELIADPQIEIVVNLTMPAEHHGVTMAALSAGKHVFSEKPLTINRQLGKEIVQTAARKVLRLAGAPDTFLGAGLQACRRLIDEGKIGVPITAQALLAAGHSSERYYNIFTGPMFDMGPYYLTALLSLLGPVRRVTGSAQTPFAEKPYPPDSPDFGKTWRVSRPGNISGVLDFAAGCVGVITTTAEAGGYHPRLEVYGSEGTLITNDPNSYTGPVTLLPQKGDPERIPLPEGFPAWGRGLGVAELAQAVRAGRAARASGDLMYHVLDIMHGIHDASAEERHLHLDSGPPRPEPFELADLLGR